MKAATENYTDTCGSCSRTFKNTSDLIEHRQFCIRCVQNKPRISDCERNRMLVTVRERIATHHERCPCVDGILANARNKKCSMWRMMHLQEQRILDAMDPHD